ncbi:MAG: nitroreductase family protein [Pseudobdellovibrionaceae bacterium]|jgi:SagB-type dehydrogenase family enzyme
MPKNGRPGTELQKYTELRSRELLQEFNLGQGLLKATALVSEQSLRFFKQRITAGKIRIAGQNHLTLYGAERQRAISLKGLAGSTKGLSFSRLTKKRRSSRVFSKGKIELSQVAYLLENSLGRSISKAGNLDCVDVSLWIRNVNGLKNGFYRYDCLNKCLLSSKPSTKIRWSAEYMPANTSVLLCLRARPELLIEAYGARGWRFLWISLGSSWAHFYLAAADLKLGCCGLGGMPELLGLDVSEKRNVQPAAFMVFGKIN